MNNPTLKAKQLNFFGRFLHYWHLGHAWMLKTPERALEEAYNAALRIQKIEKEHFGGQNISFDSGNYSYNTFFYFQSDLNKHLDVIKLRLAEFKTSRLLLRNSSYVFLDKLSTIDRISSKYQILDEDLLVLQANNSSLNSSVKESARQKTQVDSSSNPSNHNPIASHKNKHFARTINNLKIEANSGSEEEVLQGIRRNRRTNQQAIKFIFLLVFIPLFAQICAKQLLFLPLVDRYRNEEENSIFINWEMKEEAIKELQSFKEELQFENLLARAPNIAAEAIEEKVSDKANELAQEFSQKGNNAIANIFADLLGLFAFAGVIIVNPKGVIAFKSFLNKIVFGLSDSAKAFIIILFTDMFVGFHSPHGWEVLLEGLANHLGIPANHSAIFLFIATFPVILDAMFKYWIFRYLNQISPSAVATLKNMNE
jgi:hypothetical protein